MHQLLKLQGRRKNVSCAASALCNNQNWNIMSSWRFWCSFVDDWLLKNNNNNFVKLFVVVSTAGKSSVLLDIKPWDDETDMKKLEETVRSIQMDGLLWGACTFLSVLYNSVSDGIVEKLSCLLTALLWMCSQACSRWVWHKKVADYDDHCRWPSVSGLPYRGTPHYWTGKWVHPELWYCCLQQNMYHVFSFSFYFIAFDNKVDLTDLLLPIIIHQ